MLKLTILEQLYDIYDEFLKNFELACKKGCSHCCTCNVTLTTIEGYNILDYLTKENRLNLLLRLSTSKKRFLPKFTINQFAELCINGEDIPEEKNNPNWGVCTFLSDNKCSIYKVRPFACRAMISEKNCNKTEYALIKPFLLTVNNVFLQYIEHIDLNGYFGNIADIIALLSESETRVDYIKNNLSCSNDLLILNKKIKFLMIPPEDRTKIKPLLNNINSIFQKKDC